MSFSVQRFGAVSALTYDPWRERGIVHGFTLAPADFGGSGVERWGGEMCAALGCERLALLHQVHGDVCRELPLDRGGAGDAPEGDAFAWDRASGFDGIFGVKAADCVPILGYSNESCFAIHAGWRGLAGGVIERTLRRDGARGCEWLIGPCAGPDGYEVGPEVIGAIGSPAVARERPDGRFELDLARTAERLIGQTNGGARVTVIPVNTVIDRRFHSHRRDGSSAGRGLGFFVV